MLPFCRGTAKTQFVYRINKGVLDVSDDKALNDSMPDESKRVPFTNMIYIGDGLSDEELDAPAAVDQALPGQGDAQLGALADIASAFREIYASEFLYDAGGRPLWPKLAVNFTAKTQFVSSYSRWLTAIFRMISCTVASSSVPSR